MKILNQRGGFEHCSREELMGPHANHGWNHADFPGLAPGFVSKTCIIRTLLLKYINYHINIY